MRIVGTMWGVLGFSAFILFALFRLTLTTLQGLQFELNGWHWAVLICNLAFMAYSEGYRGFQRSYSPKFAARVVHLKEHGRALECWLAPLYCMGYFGATKRQLIATYILTLGIIALIVLFHLLAQPWRGILDAGVVVGLAWGLLATWACTARALRLSSAYSLSLETR